MNTTRGLVGAALFGSVLILAGCGGSGTYQIPDVAPVVKQKPDDDLLENIEGDDKPAASATAPAATAAPPEGTKTETPPAEAAKPKPAKK